MMVRYVAVDAGRKGDVIAIGRDDRATALAQGRLLEAQRTMERDYSRLRDAESRYRLLFETSAEAVLVVDAASRRIVEANPAAQRLIGGAPKPAGELFAKIFDAASQDEAAALLPIARSSAQSDGAQMRLPIKSREFLVSASLFRQDRATQCLVRLTPADQGGEIPAQSDWNVQALLERMPDAFVVTDGQTTIHAANAAFLDLAGIAGKGQAIGCPLSQFLGRAGHDRNILMDSLREHGSVHNFATVLRGPYAEQVDVEVSAASAPHGANVVFGFSIRASRRDRGEPSQTMPELRRSVEQLTELVGRVKLKDLVRETTDLIERLSIEAALELTKDNRASAADLLGLSRQSLYSKLHRFGLGNLNDKEN
jgi:transcriptional regulator PpsR